MLVFCARSNIPGRLDTRVYDEHSGRQHTPKYRHWETDLSFRLFEARANNLRTLSRRVAGRWRSVVVRTVDIVHPLWWAIQEMKITSPIVSCYQIGTKGERSMASMLICTRIWAGQRDWDGLGPGGWLFKRFNVQSTRVLMHSHCTTAFNGVYYNIPRLGLRSCRAGTYCFILAGLLLLMVVNFLMAI